MYLRSSLVQAARTAAAQMRIERLYVATADAARLFERGDWTLVETIEHDGERLSLFATDLRP